jgi:peptidoglycan/xylan/chitin deacetylase (PgdA/CDA1 family)
MKMRPTTSGLLAAVALCTWLMSAPAARAAGPAVVAKADASLWAERIDTRAGFDKASRAALLVYAQVLQDMGRLSDAQMQAAFEVRSVNRVAVARWLGKEAGLSAASYGHAAAGCAKGDWTCVEPPASPAAFLQAATAWVAKVPPAAAAWHANLAAFARAYVAEQLRLAALFPKVSSEIDRFDDQEWNGDDLPDLQFLLSFDDGPTLPGGTTDETLAMLAAQKKSAIFFMLGGNLEARRAKAGATALAERYAGQCVASHGWEHQSHAKWAAWRDSVVRTQALLHAVFPASAVLPYFRPPYGERTADSGAFFREQGLQVALWNLDSQDWNAQVTPADIVDRMTTLMLLKRHGVLLFHDVHPKAQVALPVIFEKLGKAVEWRECHSGSMSGSVQLLSNTAGSGA